MRTTFSLLFCASAISSTSPVQAQETFLPQKFIPDRIDYPVIQQSVYFSSIDTARSTFGNVGLKWAPRSLDRTGPALMVISGFGQGVGRFDDMSYLENKNQFAAMAGYQWSFEKVMLGTFIGAEFDSRNDIYGRARLEGGIRAQAEIWSNPTPQSMLSVTMIASSIHPSLWSRAALGLDLKQGLYLGPETSIYITDDYQEGRFGLHLTGIKIGPLHFRLSGGGWRDSDQRRGAYGQLTGYVRM